MRSVFLIEKRLLGFLKLIPYSFSQPLIQQLLNLSLSFSDTGFCSSHCSYSWLAFSLKRRRGRRPFSVSLTSTNQANNACWTSGAFVFRPPLDALTFFGGHEEGSVSYRYLDMNGQLAWKLSQILDHCYGHQLNQSRTCERLLATYPIVGLIGTCFFLL